MSNGKLTSLNGHETLSGTWGYVLHEGEWLNNVEEVEASVEIEKGEIRVIGDMWKKFKTLGLSGSGKMNVFKINYNFAKKIAEVAKQDGKVFVTELVFQLDDPAVTGARDKVRLKNVQFDVIPLVNFKVNEAIKEELPFTFEGFEFLEE